MGIAMTAQVFRAALRDLDLTQVAAAEFLRVRPTTVNRWARGRRKVPGPVAAALQCLRERRALEAQIGHQRMLTTSTTSSIAGLAAPLYGRRDNRLSKP